MWKGAAAILNPSPAKIMTMASFKSGSPGAAITAVLIGCNASEPEKP